MKSSYKLVLLAALGMASVAAAQTYTSGDLLVGVYQPGVGNTEVYDLGSFSSLFDGEQISLVSALGAAGFGSSLSSSAQFGLVGANTAGNGSISHTVFETTASFTPGTIGNYQAFGGLKSDIATLGNNQGAQAINTGADFLSAISLGSGYLADDLGYSIAGSVTGGISLWSVLDDGSSPTLDGTLTLNPSTETLTYNAVPEPTTLGLLGGAGMLIIAFRNKLGRKKS